MFVAAGSTVFASAYVSTGEAFAANTNSINWKIISTYYGAKGEDIPLRYGQHNQGQAQGFGLYHIEDDHDRLPSTTDLADTLEFGKCTYQKSNNSYQCLYDSTHGNVIAIFTERVDSRSKDGRPVGIITAYYEDGNVAGIKNHTNVIIPK